MRRYMWANLAQSDYSLHYENNRNTLFSSYFGFNSGIDSYQITCMFDITLNINDRVDVLQDRCTLIIEGGFSR